MAEFIGTKHKDVFAGTDDGDLAFGGGGKDRLSGGAGADRLAGEDGADVLDGGDGNDVLYAGAVDPHFLDLFDNGVSYDTGAEKDKLTGGAGDDSIFAGAGDVVDGGAHGSFGDRLYISFMGATAGVNADFRLLYDHEVLKVAGGSIRNIQNVGYLEGSDFDDLLASIDTAYPSGTSIFGRGGNDHLIGNGYSGWSGAGLWGGDGDDEIDATAGAYGPSIYGEAGNDVLRNGSGPNNFSDGGAGDDTIVAGGSVFGGEGDDVITLQYSYYFEQAFGGEGDDLITAAVTGSTISGGAGEDILTGDMTTDRLYGGDNNDAITGGAGDDTIAGGLGRDSLTGGAGADVFLFEYADLSPLASRADRIRDFSHADHDIINLAQVDAVSATDKVDHFTFIGAAAFSGVAGELRYGFVDGSTLVEGDTNGDGVGDAFLRLDGELALTSKDFELRNLQAIAPADGLAHAHAHAFALAAAGAVLA